MKAEAQLSDRVRADVERRRSGASGTHGDRRTKRNRDRSSQRRKAIEEAREKE